jgi:hypothetical protein
MALRTYQQDLAQRAADLINAHGVAYLAMEVRTGKTLTAMQAAAIFGAREVLFVTKKKAIDSIRYDFRDRMSGAGYKLEVLNYEALPKYTGECDFLILDEAHGLGAYPKPSGRAEMVREIVVRTGCKCLLLSGTPTPESYAQLFHQLWACGVWPWAMAGPVNFYKWHAEYGIEKKQWIAGREIKIYSEVKQQRIKDEVKHLMLTYTQAEAGFDGKVVERFDMIPMPDKVAMSIRLLRKNKAFNTKSGGMVLADTAAKEMQKIHQLCGGTIKTEEGERIVFDLTKAQRVHDLARPKIGEKKKVAVFYKYIAERTALEMCIGPGCETPEDFNAMEGPALIYLQIQSGREGVNLSTADLLIMYNIDFAAVSYWQARARMQTFDRKEPAQVLWLMFENGIEEKIYRAVMEKKDYTTSHYRRELF